jgi:hypothetical protein
METTYRLTRHEVDGDVLPLAGCVDVPLDVAWAASVVDDTSPRRGRCDV